MDALAGFREIWLVDFEFCAQDGERPLPLCLVARELRTGRMVRQWLDPPPPRPPFAIGPDSLFVAYYASAELGCFLALNWPMPARILDLLAEFRCLTSGSPVPCGNGLLGALAYHGLDGLAAVEKDSMRQLAMRGRPYTAAEQAALLAYCETDVDALARLLPAMLPRIDLPRALLRGRYMAAAARIEWQGIPIDTEALATLRMEWTANQDRLIERIDAGRGIYAGRTFKADRFAGWLAEQGIPWPRLASGALDLSDDCFHEMGRAYPDKVSPIRELRHGLSQLRLEELAVGADCRNRCLLSAFGSKTGRNQPSNSRFIFGPSTWLRGLIRPEPGNALAYVDWEQQEFGIAAALSGDKAMMHAYRSADPYLTFAKQAGAVPADATKETHKAQRERFKVLSLAVQYGMGPDSLARRLDESPARGRELIGLHRQTYPTYWRWSDAVEMTGMLTGRLQAAFGWTVQVGPDANPRSLRNFPLQGNGSEMLRLACILATERGIRVCAPVHDALLIEAPIGAIDAAVADTQRAMQEASELVLPGFPLRTEAKIVRWPDRYADPRGAQFWRTVWELIGEREGSARATQRVAPVLPPSPLISSLMYSLADPPAYGTNRPGALPTAGEPDGPGETIPTPAAAQSRREVPERPNPVELVATCNGIARQGAPSSLALVAGSRLAEESDGSPLSPRRVAGRLESVERPARVGDAGSRGAGDSRPEARPRVGSDDTRGPANAAVLDVADLAELQAEREAIQAECCPPWTPAELEALLEFP